MLLKDEEISQAKKGHTAVIQEHPSVYPQDIAVAKAQLKKVVEWLIEEYGEFMYDENTGLRNDKPIFIKIDPDEAPWQALLDEVKDAV